MLAEPVKVEMWKAHAWNQLGEADDRRSAAIQAISQKTYSATVTKDADFVKIVCPVSLSGPAVVPVLGGEIVYKFYGDGSAVVGFNGEFRQLLIDMDMHLPRFGFAFKLNGGYENMEYFGKLAPVAKANGVGDKTAVKLLQKYGTLENILANTDQEKGKLREKLETWPDQARMCKELATIRRDAPVDFKLADCKLPDLKQAIPAKEV